MTIALIDADSMCYAAGSMETWNEASTVLESYVRDCVSVPRCDSYEMYVEPIQGGANFRRHVAVSRPYKGNRAGRSKPHLWGDAKRCLIEEYGAHVVYYMESEDAVRIRANELGIPNVVMCCIDKDLYQQYGAFYNFKTGQRSVVSPENARHKFWRQMVTGDSTDNIPGIPNAGPSAFEAIAAECEDIPRAVLSMYADKGLPYSYVLEQGRLLHILTKRNEVWIPPMTEEEYNGL